MVIDNLRVLALVFGRDDDLDVGEVGNRVELDFEERPDASSHQHEGENENQEAVPERVFDDAGNHDMQ